MAEAVKKEEVKKGPLGKLKDAISIRQEFAEWLLREDKEIHHEIVSLKYIGESSEYDI